MYLLSRNVNMYLFGILVPISRATKNIAFGKTESAYLGLRVFGAVKVICAAPVPKQKSFPTSILGKCLLFERKLTLDR